MPATHDTHSPKTDTQPFHTVAAQIYPFHLVIRKRTKDFTLGYTRLKSAFGKFHIVNRALFSAADGVHHVWLHRVWHHVLHSLRSSSAEADKQNKEETMADVNFKYLHTWGRTGLDLLWFRIAQVPGWSGVWTLVYLKHPHTTIKH